MVNIIKRFVIILIVCFILAPLSAIGSDSKIDAFYTEAYEVYEGELEYRIQEIEDREKERKLSDYDKRYKRYLQQRLQKINSRDYQREQQRYDY